MQMNIALNISMIILNIKLQIIADDILKHIAMPINYFTLCDAVEYVILI